MQLKENTLSICHYGAFIETLVRKFEWKIVPTLMYVAWKVLA